VYISRDVIFDEHIFSFANLPTSNTLPVTESSLLSADQFMDTTYAPSLLANHGAGVGRGARLELLTPEAPSAPSVHVDHVHGVASGPVLMHGSATSEPRTSPPSVAPHAPPPGVAPCASSPGIAQRAPLPGVAQPSLQLQGVASDPPEPSSAPPSPEPTTPMASGSAPESPRFDASPSLSPSPIVQSPPTSSPAPAPPVYTVPVTRRQRGIVQKKVRTDSTIA
jgi:hypothetical protein